MKTIGEQSGWLVVELSEVNERNSRYMQRLIVDIRPHGINLVRMHSSQQPEGFWLSQMEIMGLMEAMQHFQEQEQRELAQAHEASAEKEPVTL